MIHELALFAGAGGGQLATQYILGYRTVCYVEWDQFCVHGLRSRIAEGLLHDAPIWSDARSFTKKNGTTCRFMRELTRVPRLVVTAGFPCQPFSVAGQRQGELDPRNMWPATFRIIRELRPGGVILENVPGLLSAHGYFEFVLGCLATIGYDAVWGCLSAATVGARHKRKRLFVVAYPNSGGVYAEPRHPSERATPLLPDRYSSVWTMADAHGAWQSQSTGEGDLRMGAGIGDKIVSNTERERLEGLLEIGAATGAADRPGDGGNGGWWEVEPGVGRVVDGMAHRLDRLKSCGNGIVPLQLATAVRMLIDRIE